MVDAARSDMSEHTIDFVQMQALRALGELPG